MPLAPSTHVITTDEMGRVAAPIMTSVGQDAVNAPGDVFVIQSLLIDRLPKPHSPVAVTGLAAHFRLAGRPMPHWATAAILVLIAYATLVRGNAVFATVPLALGFSLIGLGIIVAVTVTERGKLFRPHHAPDPS